MRRQARVWHSVQGTGEVNDLEETAVGSRLSLGTLLGLGRLLAQPFRVEGLLVVEQMMAQPIDLMSHVQDGPDPTLASGLSALVKLGQSWDLLEGMEADQVQGIAQGGLAFAGNLTDPPKIATFLADRVKASKSPNLLRLSEALGMTQMSQITGGLNRTDPRN